MAKFNFKGEISSSKSMMNRALILKSYDRDVKVQGFSHCDDVQKMHHAIETLEQSTEFNCGEAGTVLRFLIFRVARKTGTFKLTGTERLFMRPQAELKNILNELGVKTKWFANSVEITSEGWKKPDSNLVIDRRISSQFASGLLLNAWDLPFDLELRMHGPHLSEGYLQMTIELLKQAGMEILIEGDKYKIKAGQKIKNKNVSVEPDMSSVFAIATMAALGGSAEINQFPSESLQPDFVFLKIFEQMKIHYEYNKDQKILKIFKSENLIPLKMNISNCPDLFPVLSILCAMVKGESHLFGAPHLHAKESNRIEKTCELLKWIEAAHKPLPDGIKINGRPFEMIHELDYIFFYPDKDHRMAMAAGILARLGLPIEVSHPEVVEKSFPEFWKILGVSQ